MPLEQRQRPVRRLEALRREDVAARDEGQDLVRLEDVEVVHGVPERVDVLMHGHVLRRRREPERRTALAAVVLWPQAQLGERLGDRVVVLEHRRMFDP